VVRPPRKAQPVPNRRATNARSDGFDHTVDNDLGTPLPAPETEAPVRLEVDDLDGALLAVHTAGSVEALAKGVIGLLKMHQPADCMTVLVRKEDSYVRAEAVGAPPEAQGVKIDAQDALGRRIERGTRVHSVDVRGKAIRQMGGSYLYPCKGRSAIVGGIVTSAHERDKAHHEWVSRLAPHVGIALDNLTRTGGGGGSARAQAELERLHAATRKLVAASPLGVLLQRIVREAVRVTKAEKASLMLYDLQKGDLELKAARGLYDAAMERRIQLGELPAMRVPSDMGAIGHVFRTGETLRATGASGTSTPEGLNGPSLIVSISAMGRALGVLQLTSTTPNPRFATRAKYIEGYARSAGLAIWSAQAYQRVAIDRAGGLSMLPVAEAWIESAMLTARRKKVPFTVILARMGSSEGEPPSPKRVAKFSEVLRKAAPAGFDLGGHDGRGMFLVGLPNMQADAAKKIAQRITSEMGTMYYGESTWCFVIAERGEGESCFALLSRARIALDQAWEQGPGVRLLVAKGR
jgi:hypothetical protein